MKHSASWVELNSSRRKYVTSWLPNGRPQAIVLIVHGLGEHAGRYHTFAEKLTQEQYGVYGFDQQGHGHSPEKRGCIASYGSMLADIEAVLNWLSSRHDDLPLVLFGHSMGGNLVLNYAVGEYAEPVGVIASSPMIRAANPPAWLFEKIARGIKLLHPNMTLKSQIIPERLMSDPEEQERLLNDDLFHSQLSLRLGGALLDTGRQLLEKTDRLAIPTLLTHGTNDSMTCPEASQEFAVQCEASCRFELLDGMSHDPFRDLDKQRAFTKYFEFLESLQAR